MTFYFLFRKYFVILRHDSAFFLMKFSRLIIYFLLCNSVFAQKDMFLEKPKVDKRVEFLSIVFRIADAPDYNFDGIKLYIDKIQQYYSPYKNHELIHFIKKIQPEKGIYFGKVMCMAIHLDENFNPIIPFSDKIPDTNWGKETAEEFVILLKKFYHDTKSEKFFKQNKSFYKKVSKRFEPIYNKIDLNWFKTFYGKNPNENFLIINAIANGKANYGVSLQIPNQERRVYAIMGASSSDEKGMPVFEVEKYFPTLIHEFNHSFVNYLLDQNPVPFQKNGEQIFEFVKDKMQKLYYDDWRVMLNEALVRAAVIKYMKDKQFSNQEIEKEIQEQIKEGFVWIEDLVAELEKYDTQRTIYPTLENYLPELIKAYEKFAQKMPQYLEKCKN